ncbi:hypothetical protein NP493_28g12051 [Ridgeia piscesae]|uniref:PEP5/VPS11 N-terminal domain-containing protein n=1 Tax=Ridgeia piscesae TaxID=27915 RepID=A0AAD9PDC5_RIDPI|nr:hypothetical protein NP493_28g12051 [Ridgeia piscesae]
MTPAPGLQEAVLSLGRGQLVLGDEEGSLYFVSRQLDVSSFHAYELCVTHLYQLKQHNILVTVGEDEPGLNPLIKVWNLNKVEKGNPLCSRIARAIPGNTPTKVTCLTVHENLNHMAVGFQNGSIVLFKGDVTKERHSKQRVIHEGPHPITGLAFKSQSHSSVLFVSTEHAVMSFTVHTKSKDVTMCVLDSHGCRLRCCTDSTLESQFVIGRRDAVYFYQTDERGPCLAFEGEKLQLHWYRGYLIVVGRENKPLPRAGAGSSGHAMTQMYTVTLYDIKNKFIAFSAAVPEVVDVICEWGSPYILTVDGKLYQLREKDTQTKLETLFKKNLYVVAISLAQSQHYDQDGVVDIYRQYGDHLYSQSPVTDCDTVTGVFCFLDASRIHNLTAYLEALHKAQLATEDHTTLLLNCCTKLKDVKKLDDFIMTKDREVDFDVETAIRVCRSAGYYRHAVFLAEKHHQHDWYLKIQLDDVKDYGQALTYISKLDFDEAEMYMKKYGKMLMNEQPEKTTDLLKTLCTDYRPSDSKWHMDWCEGLHV